MIQIAVGADPVHHTVNWVTPHNFGLSLLLQMQITQIIAGSWILAVRPCPMVIKLTQKISVVQYPTKNAYTRDVRCVRNAE